jgi:hypothetical protein
MRFAFRLLFYTFLLLLVVLLFFQFTGLYRIYDFKFNTGKLPMSDSDTQDIEQLNRQIVELSSSNTMVTFDQLEQALVHRSETIRYRALRAVKNDISTRFTRYLIDRVLHDPSPSIRSYALSLLANKPNQGILPIVVASLMDPAMEVQDVALTYLAANHRRDAADTIISTTHRTIPTSSHLRALGILGGKDAINFLCEFALRNPDRKEESLFYLAKTGDSAVPDILDWMIEQKDDPDSHAILPVFRWLDSNLAFEQLRSMAEDSKLFFQKIGFEGISYLPSNESLDYLNVRLKTEKSAILRGVILDAIQRHSALCSDESKSTQAF